MVNEANLIILHPPSDRSRQFEYYCAKNHYSKLEFTAYVEFLKDILSRLFNITKEDGLCCLIFPKSLASENEVIYSHIISMGASPTENRTWSFHDEIILTDKNDQLLGKISVLKKNHKIETISRAERLTHISIPAEEKELISESVWKVDVISENSISEKIVSWLILSYSNSNDQVYDPFSEITNTQKISLKLRRYFVDAPL